MLRFRHDSRFTKLQIYTYFKLPVEFESIEGEFEEKRTSLFEFSDGASIRTGTRISLPSLETKNSTIVSGREKKAALARSPCLITVLSSIFRITSPTLNFDFEAGDFSTKT